MSNSHDTFWVIGRNQTLDELRDKLAEEIELDYGLSPEDDIQVVRWDRIEDIIDEMYV